MTDLNGDLFADKELAQIEELWVDSSFDGRPLQAWLALPPGVEEGSKLPLILEIHGGPFANYGARFSAEVQLYAAAGYAVLYGNPRGSTSYGKEFGNLIHHNYPGEDYDDLMSMVDAVVERGVADPDRLFAAGAVVLALVAGPLAAGEETELILSGGRIWTGDSAQPWAQAVAVSGDRLIAVENAW